MSQYVFTYQGHDHPTAEEENALTSALGQMHVVQRIPGTLLVNGEKSALTQVAEQFGNWRLSPVVKLSTNPPRKRVVRQATED